MKTNREIVKEIIVTYLKTIDNELAKVQIEKILEDRDDVLLDHLNVLIPAFVGVQNEILNKKEEKNNENN